MKIAKKLALSIFCCIFIASCGYTIARYDKNTSTKYYIERVQSGINDTTYEQITQDVLDRYFITYGEFASHDNANYFLNLRINNVSIHDSILTSTEEAAASDLIINCTITVYDINDVIVFSKNFSATDSFNVSSNIAQSLINRDNAIETVIEDILESYRNSFNTRF